MTRQSIPDFLKLAKLAAQISDERKGHNVMLLSVKRLTAVADYFVIVTGLSAPHLTALSSIVRKTFREEYGLEIVHTEGRGSPNWVVLDYGGLVVHFMTEQAREFYALENLWDEARKLKF